MSDTTGPIRAVVSDFGGVLTSPLHESFDAVARQTNIPLEGLGKAMGRLAAEDGTHPLFELERGHLTEAEFIAAVEGALEQEIGRRVSLAGLHEAYFQHLRTNEPMIDYLREVRRRGLRLGLLTNNIREWEPRWRSMLPVDEIFHVVVDSAFVGMRKPERRIYEVTLELLEVEPAATVFIDDLEINCEAAEALGMTAVRFRTAEQAIEEIEAALTG